MGNQAGYSSRPAAAAFTLVELLLTVTLFLLLAAAAVFNFDSLHRGGRLEEGVSLMESLLRYSRAQAAGTGRTVRVSFGPPDSASLGGTNSPTPPAGGVQVLWEVDALNVPGQFETMHEADSFADHLNELVEIRRVRFPSSISAANSLTLDPVGAPTNAGTNHVAVEPMAHSGTVPITFYPDGSSDSVEIILASRDPEDSRLVALKLSGVVGTTRRKWLSAEAADPAAMEPEEEANLDPSE